MGSARTASEVFARRSPPSKQTPTRTRTTRTSPRRGSAASLVPSLSIRPARNSVRTWSTSRDAMACAGERRDEMEESIDVWKEASRVFFFSFFFTFQFLAAPRPHALLAHTHSHTSTQWRPAACSGSSAWTTCPPRTMSSRPCSARFEVRNEDERGRRRRTRNGGGGVATLFWRPGPRHWPALPPGFQCAGVTRIS